MNCEKLKELRERRGLYQKEVAIELGITQAGYSLYESGHRQPDYQTLRQLAKYFNVSTDYLLDAELPDKEEFLDIRGISDKGKQIVLIQLENVRELEKAHRERDALKSFSSKPKPI
jgi:transcriptional regulator with XRE-family HTH domain